jgi:MFS family permease
MTFQEYVFEPCWEALHISPHLHDALGCYIDFDRSEPTSFLHLSSHVFVGTTRNFTGALLTRFFLGFVEASFFPGALFLLSKWYKRDELGLRTAILSCGLLISNAFGSLIASGILSGMQGKLGFTAWRSVALMRGQAFSPSFILGGFFTSKVH